jgi:hypothetical protein
MPCLDDCNCADPPDASASKSTTLSLPLPRAQARRRPAVLQSRNYLSYLRQAAVGCQVWTIEAAPPLLPFVVAGGRPARARRRVSLPLNGYAYKRWQLAAGKLGGGEWAALLPVVLVILVRQRAYICTTTTATNTAIQHSPQCGFNLRLRARPHHFRTPRPHQ